MNLPSLNKFDANIERILAMLQTNSDTIRLDFAKALAREVGILAREMQKNLGRVEQKGHQDYVSEVDRNIEAMIHDKVIEAFPGDVMLGEELGGQTGDSLWVVDPIDGTSNFVRGQNFWCVSISYLRDGKPVVGVIYAPATDELFYAQAGRGAFCNGAPMRVKKVNNESEAVIEMDWSPSESPEELISMLAKFLKAGFEFHRSGSCALCLANVANGKMDAYWEVFTKPWDALAGYLLVKEAGGQTNDFESNLFENQGNLIIAASPELFGKIVKLF